DQNAIAEVRADAWPDVRHADELHDALQSLVAVPDDFVPASGEPLSFLWSHGIQHLVAERRAGIASVETGLAPSQNAVAGLAPSAVQDGAGLVDPRPQPGARSGLLSEQRN